MESGDKQDMLHKDKVTPDHELLLWEKWIQIRKAETNHLAEKLGRVPADLTLNLLEKIRENKERKTVLEEAQIEKKPTVRGFLWEQPQRLKQKCYCEPVYEISRTRAEKGRPRVIEHVGVPQYIQATEKGITGISKRISCSQLNREYKDYRIKRENDLKESIKKIDPYRPDLNNLMIKGNKPKAPPKKMPASPEIQITAEIDGPLLLESVFALKINNTIFIKDELGQNLRYLEYLRDMQRNHEPCTSWSYYFNAPTSRVGRSKLVLQNLGNVTLRYCWKKIRRSIPFIPEQNEQVFYFNKNEDVLSPGQTKEIFFTFISNKPGIYSESWELSTCNVCFFDRFSDKIIINLQGDSVENVEKTKCKVEFIKGRINRKAIKNIVRSILNELVEIATSVKPQIYPYKHLFLEAEIFVMKNPVCFYHQTEVAKMKEVYTEMVPGDSWDLSITSWRQKMMEKQYEERMKYYDILKKSHIHLLKPWFEGEDLLHQKYRNVKMLLGQLADKFDMEYVRITNTMAADIQQTENIDTPASTLTIQSTIISVSVDPLAMNTIQNVFYVRAYEHVAETMELCAGVLSSLDLNRWIDFDFCRT